MSLMTPPTIVEKVAVESLLVFGDLSWIDYILTATHTLEETSNAQSGEGICSSAAAEGGYHRFLSVHIEDINVEIVFPSQDIPTKTIPLAMKIGRRPFSSLNGASSIGARAKPMQKIVILRLYTTALIPHSTVNSSEAGLTSPAAKPASAVTAQAM
jgi:hypothetical protein